MQACGAWIRGSVGLDVTEFNARVEYLAFADGAERAAAVRHAEAELYDGARLATTNLGKFRAACQRTVLGGTAAVRAAGELAYAHLVSEAAVDAVADARRRARVAGGARWATTATRTVLFGWELATTGYVTSVRRGVAYGSYVLADALAVVRASGVLQAEAEAANAWVNANAMSSRVATTGELLTVLRAATERPASEDALADLDAVRVYPRARRLPPPARAQHERVRGPAAAGARLPQGRRRAVRL